MPSSGEQYRDTAETLVVSLARTGDRDAFAELVRRRQSWIRNLMRRFSDDMTLADDLAQQVFLQAWRKISSLKNSGAFGPWLKRIAISIWLQHLRAKDTLEDADPFDELPATQSAPDTMALDLDAALSRLPGAVRLCIVLNYHEGQTHAEIAEVTGLPLGTVKSHIRRGTETLRNLLSAYQRNSQPEAAK